MVDSVGEPIQICSEYNTDDWRFNCKSWQYDRILERFQFNEKSTWPQNPYPLICSVGDPSGFPPDIIVIQIRYRNSNGHHVLPINFWIKKDVVDVTSREEVERNHMSAISLHLMTCFKNMNPDGDLVGLDMIHELIDVARKFADMPQNAGRKGLSFVYEISGYPKSNPPTRVKKLVDPTHCGICGIEFSHGENVVWIPCCKHNYHKKCIFKRLNSSIKTCPQCNFPIP